MMAVVGRMPLWAGESQDIYLAKSADVVDGVVVVETAMLMDSKAAGAEYRQVEGHDPQGLKVAGADDADGAEAEGLKNNPDGAEEQGLRA